ncbi:MAG: FmdB family zinc ribbon protein [Chloroflexota bacterium]
MPIYTYRREDGTEFDIRQKFSDDPLTVDPETGQKVQRVIQPAGIVFKGSGFYVNDSKGSKANLSTPANGNGNSNGAKEDSGGSSDSGTKESASTDTTTKAEKKASATTSKAKSSSE